MKFPEVDEYCEKIFAFLALQDEPLGFNKLHQELNKANLKISRPTLSAHLKHLLKHKAITKKPKGTQELSYDVNWKKIDYLKYHKDFRKAAERIQQNKKTFEQFDLNDKIGYVCFILSLIEVTKLKYEIQAYLEPNRHFEAVLTYLFIKSYLEPFRMYLLRDTIHTKETAEKGLTIIEEFEQTLQNELFTAKTPQDSEKMKT